MKLAEKYFNKIDLSSHTTLGQTTLRGYSWINNEILKVPLKNIKKLEFNSLYANIVSGLVDREVHIDEKDSIKITMSNFRDQFNYFEKNKSELKWQNPLKYKDLKTNINSFYGQLGFLSRTNMSKNYPGFVSQYLRYFYDDLLEHNRDNIVYIDTDDIYYIDDINLLDNNIEYTTENIDYAIFFDFKNFVLMQNGIISNGPLHRSSKKVKDKDEQISILKRYIRQDKIETIGIK